MEPQAVPDGRLPVPHGITAPIIESTPVRAPPPGLRGWPVHDWPRAARNCSDRALRFPNDYTGDEHDTGAVWAAVLWSIRQQIGAAITDRVVLESLNFLGPGSSFDDARVALHTVDERLNGNTHRQLIDDEFTGRAPA